MQLAWSLSREMSYSADVYENYQEYTEEVKNAWDKQVLWNGSSVKDITNLGNKLAATNHGVVVNREHYKFR